VLCSTILKRYIFEKKEVKKAESKGKKDKDGKSDNVPEQKVIARLQVGLGSFLFSFYFPPPFKNSIDVDHCITFSYYVPHYFPCLSIQVV